MAPDGLLETLQSSLSDIRKQPLESLSDRQQLLKAAQELVVALEQPSDVIERVCFQVCDCVPFLSAYL